MWMLIFSYWDLWALEMRRKDMSGELLIALQKSKTLPFYCCECEFVENTIAAMEISCN